MIQPHTQTNIPYYYYWEANKIHVTLTATAVFFLALVAFGAFLLFSSATFDFSATIRICGGISLLVGVVGLIAFVVGVTGGGFN